MARRFAALSACAGLLGVSLAGTARAETPVALQAVSPGTDYLVMDATTGRILAEHNAYNARYPASLTKLMTLDLAFRAMGTRHLTFDTQLPVSMAASRVQPVKLDLVAGQTISAHDAMLGMTTLSANDAATALGQYLGGGSIERFASEMTGEARALGMRHTVFRNPSGLPDPDQVTNAYDMAILTRHILLTYPQYRYLFSVSSFQFEGRPIPNIDGMLRLYPGAIGMKTGYTNLARFNLVTAAVRDNHLLIGVELHSRSWSQAYQGMTHLLDAGFIADGVQQTGPIIAMRRGLPSILPVADAAVPRVARMAAPHVTRMAEQRDARKESMRLAALRHRHDRRTPEIVAMRDHAQLRRVSAHSGHVTQEEVAGWTAQIGAYRSYTLAKRQALVVRAERHVGTARVSSAVIRHRRIWRAQLAGLNETAAHATCRVLSHHHQPCFVISPRNESLAMR